MTASLHAIDRAVPDRSRGKMVSVKTQADRTVFFDLLTLDLGEIMGYKTGFRRDMVAGQVFYNATAKLVLKGADAIVFVADSEVGKMEENKESLANLRANLAEYNISLDSIPWVMQYNKRDLPNVYSLDELNAELNPGGKAPFFEAVAREGKGVFETFRGISHLLMEKVTKDLRRTPGAAAAANASARTANAAAAAAAMPPAPVPAAPVSNAAPPAPVPSIRHQAPVTPAPAINPPSKIDYGLEIELPNNFGAPVNRIAEAAVAPVGATTPAAAAPSPAASSVARAVQTSTSGLAAASVRVETAPAANGGTSATVQPIIIPVKLPQSGVYEIVLKIQIDANP